MDGRFCSYLRVSTDQQGQSGLGLDAQRAEVARFLDGGKWTLLGEFVEVESGRDNDRPALAQALTLCRRTKATLVVAKLDRLSRNARFLLSVIEGSGDGGVVFCDLPHIPPGPVGKFIVTQMAAVAELEAGLISQRTKAALAQAKARGVRLGGFRVRRDGATGHKISPNVGRAALTAAADARAADLAPMVRELREGGLSLHRIAAELATRSIATPRGGAWSADAVRRLLRRAGG